MAQYQIPLIDESNPFYCPSVSPNSYLATLHKSLSKSDVFKANISLYSFARILDQKLFSVDKEFYSPNDYQGHRFTDTRSRKSTGRSASSLPPYSPPSWEGQHGPAYPPGLSVSKNNQHALIALEHPASAHALKRKRSTSSNTFSDLEGPTKRERSSESIHDSSFELSGKAERLFGTPLRRESLAFGSKYARILLPPETAEYEYNLILSGNKNELLARIQTLQDELYGPHLGSETPRSLKKLLDFFDSILPGIGIRKRFYVLDDLTHQKIADVLAYNGHLNVHVLNALRTSEIKSLSLTTSINDADGLNLTGRDILPVFSKPNSFLFLSELLLSGTPLQDSDIAYIHHLNLGKLVLDDTEIGNEAVFLLVTLKHSLVFLSIASNPTIDDHAVPALLLLCNLNYLSIVDTGIGMNGLRLLAGTIHEEDRIIDIEIPTVCEFYIDNIHTKYMADPEPPLIVDPTACGTLSLSALQRNLAEHAVFNPTIVVSGTEAELAARLENILQTRQMDMLVRDMICGEE